LGIIWHPLLYTGIGAVSHIFIDCLTVSGVPLLLPLSHKVFVIFSRKWRVKTGSIREFFLLAILMVLVGGASYSPLNAIRVLTGDYRMALRNYMEKGDLLCYLEGTIRMKTGEIKRGRWLIVGTEGNYGVAIFDGDRLWHIPPLIPLKVHIRCTDKRWPCHRIYGLKLAKKKVFFFDKSGTLQRRGT